MVETTKDFVETRCVEPPHAVKVELLDQETADRFGRAIFPAIGDQPMVKPAGVWQPRNKVDEEDSESVDSSNFGSDEECDDEIARPQLKFEKCKVLLGKPEEDALDWVTRYCDISQFNRWGTPGLTSGKISRCIWMALPGSGIYFSPTNRGSEKTWRQQWDPRH